MDNVILKKLDKKKANSILAQIKQNNSDRITLLLGNHDCGYAISKYICESRMDKKNYRLISKLFDDNRDIFQLADEAYINDKHFIFSHAGINKKYAELSAVRANKTNLKEK